MKIYDCFTFHNELNLLEIRLRILDPYVDYFVLVEATKTHAGKSKQLFFKENKNRFKRWEKKIIHIIVDDLPSPRKIYFKKAWKLSSVLGLGRWKPEIYQRNQIIRGIKNCKKEDIILVSDLDEIPNPEKFNQLIKLAKEGKVILFNQNLYKFFLNGFISSGWEGTRACNFNNFKKMFGGKADRLRRIRGIKVRVDKIFYKDRPKTLRVILNGGWHFSYLGDLKFILEKLSNFCHVEYYNLSHLRDPKKILEKIELGEDLFKKHLKIKYVPIDSTFPKEIIRNKEKYSKFIKKN